MLSWDEEVCRPNTDLKLLAVMGLLNIVSCTVHVTGGCCINALDLVI